MRRSVPSHICHSFSSQYRFSARLQSAKPDVGEITGRCVWSDSKATYFSHLPTFHYFHISVPPVHDTDISIFRDEERDNERIYVACIYEAEEYFVAWQGVLTIAYSGIPSSILQIKGHVHQELMGVVRENPGSKWPKTSLACLRDDKTLTLEQLWKLRQICSEENRALAASTPPVNVENLSVVLYDNCCLEKITMGATTPLRLPIDMSKPTSEEKAHVRGVMDEFATENLENYHLFTSRPGNRSAHYRNPKGGATLVHFLKTVPAALARFKQRVDEELPGMYDWFSDSSLHITIRALW